MSGFVKLYGSILRSSVWQESSDTRIVWITLLALADAHGLVESSVGGLAHQARVSREACEAALVVFTSPDPDDRSGVADGRRLEAVQGGWRLINHTAYRERRSTGAERTERWRRKQANDVTPRDVVTPDADPDQAAAPRGVVADPTDSFSSVADLTTTADRSKIARTPASDSPQPMSGATAGGLMRTHGSLEVRELDPPATVTRPRSGRVYLGQPASSGMVAELDIWRRQALATLPEAQRRKVPGFTADYAEIGPGLGRALRDHGAATVRDVVAWATLECAAGRIPPRHYRALFNGDSFDHRVLEAAAHVAGEAVDPAGLDPRMADAIVRARDRVANNRATLAMDPDDEGAPPPDIRAQIEQELERDEARLAELLGASRRRHA